MRSGKSIQGALSYNEEKVRLGEAEIILASGFTCEVDSLGFTQKLKRFQLLNSRRPKTKTNTLHLSLNFPPEEQISNEKLQIIALDYMNQIGFAEQPFLVYQHNDTNHPHIHILTTTIQSDGNPINQHDIVNRLSEPARKAIEIQYGLIPAEGRNNAVESQEQSSDLSSKADTKHKITNVVGEVMRSYAFTSLDEFNFILRQFNVLADRGRPDSQMYLNRGLVYTLLDNNGCRKGRSIKASEIYEKPMLNKIEEKFAANNVKKIARKKAVLSAIEFAFKIGKSPDHVVKLLNKSKIKLHFDLDTIGKTKSIYFISSKNRAILNETELGLTLAFLLEKLSYPDQSSIRLKNTKSTKETSSKDNAPYHHLGTYSIGGVIHAIFKSSPGYQGPASEPIKKKKKKKRRP